MSDDGKRLKDLLNQLATGEKIDWESEASQDISDTELIEQLKNIDAIQKVFTTQNSKPSKAKIESRNVLFEWGHLQVLEQLGEGSFGEVFRAYDQILNRDVALKLLKPDQLATFHSKLFIEEAQRVARVRNRHVLAIHGAGVNDNRAGFWADLIVGESLTSLKNLNQEELLKVAMEVGGALKAVHESGLIHGDVKAANIMIDQHGHYVLMDFGAGLESDSIQSSNHSIGSPVLMAPELFKDENKTAASDIYALGCLLFKLASNQYPVKGDNILDIAEAHNRHYYLQLSKLRPGLPKSMLSLVQSMIAANPDDRPSAMTVLDLLNSIKSEPRRRRKKRLIMGIIGSLVTGLLLASFGMYFANNERHKALLEQQKSEAVNQFLQKILGSAFNMGQGREVRVADMLDLAANNAIGQFASQPQTLAAIHEAVGNSYQNLQLLDKSQQQFADSLELKHQLYGGSHPETLEVKFKLAKVYQTMGENEKSQTLCLEIIEVAQHKSGLMSLKQKVQIVLATGHVNLGHFKQADVILDELLGELKQQGQVDVTYFLALMAQADNFLQQSKFKEAEKINREAIAVLESFDSPKPTNLIVAYNQLAIILGFEGKLAESNAIMVKSLPLAERYFGKQNIGYLRMLSNVAASMYDQKQFQQALAYQEEGEKIAEAILGKNHLTTLIIKLNKANTLVALERLKEGEELMRSVLQKAKSSLGERHIETLKLEYNLAELLNNTQRFKESMKLSQGSLVKAEEALGANHLITLLMQDNLAISRQALGGMEQSLREFEQVLAKITAAFGRKNPYFVMVKAHQVDAMIAAKQWSAATLAQQQLIDVKSMMFDASHESVVQAKQKLQKLRSKH